MANLLLEFETEARSLFDSLEEELQNFGALVWSDLKHVAGATADELAALGKQDLLALRDEAKQIVVSVAHNGVFAKAIGQWKFGHAAAMLMNALGTGLLAKIKVLAPATIESLIQDAFKAALASGLL